jgi:uncharacterized membrane protein
MKGKQKILTPKSLVIGSLVATATAFGAAIVSPLSAKAQNSPVAPTPVSPVTPTDPGNVIFNLSDDSETTTDSSTTTTTTTTDGTTTTTTTTTSTTETSSTTDSSSTQETTDSSTTDVATDSTTVLETTSVSTGVEAQSGVSTTTQTTSSSSQNVAVVLSISEQFALDTGIEFAFISGLASQLGVGGDALVGTLVFSKVRGLSGNRQTALQAFVNALQRAGALNIESFDNVAFAEFFTSYASAEELASVFNGLSDIRLLFLSRASKFFATKGFRFRLFRFQQITFAQFFVYKYTGVRSFNFLRERKK